MKVDSHLKQTGKGPLDPVHFSDLKNILEGDEPADAPALPKTIKGPNGEVYVLQDNPPAR